MEGRMNRRVTKVELFEQIRREYEFADGSIRGIAKKHGIHRRMVRQALASAVPPTRKQPVRSRPKFEQVRDFIDAILEADRKAPRKQRHTAHRIYVRLQQEVIPAVEVSERAVRHYVRERKTALGLLRRETFVPQSYGLGQEAQVDWYEAAAHLDGAEQKIYVFAMRSMASGAAFHRAYPHATQQAFFEAHQLGFHYFGGVFRQLRYDNLTSVVKKMWRGSQREQNERFIAFRSHWKFTAEFCTPAQGHEKGRVEGEAGYFRRNHLVPVPHAADYADLNRQLMQACEQDTHRLIGERTLSVGAGMVIEREHLLPLAEEPFEIAEVSFHTVDGQGCVRVRTNWYSAPCSAGTRVRVCVLPAHIEVWHGARQVASHERSFGRAQQVLELEHYLDILEHKPGALAGSKPLQQWRARGRWPESFDQLWASLQQRHGKQAGTRAMIELLMLGRSYGYERLAQAVAKALAIGCTDAAAVRHLLSAETLVHRKVEKVEIAALSLYERALPVMTPYDQLLQLSQGVAR
jgi:transposase